MPYRKRAERGSIIVYILIAIFLTGLLVATMTTGAKKSASSNQVAEAFNYLRADIRLAQQSISECAALYPTAVDINGDGDATNDNPNTPFPMYCADTTCATAGLTSGGTGTPLTNIGCPGAPEKATGNPSDPADGYRMLFNKNVGNTFKVLGDTTKYTATYFNDSTEGIFLRITPASSSAVWNEVITELDNKYSKCAAAVETASPDPTGFDCSGGCFYYWIARKSTSSAAFESGCP